MAELQKTVVYDLNGTLIPSVSKQALAEYQKRLKDVLESLYSEDAKRAESVFEKIKVPPRGSKARDVYNDFMELAIERGEIDIKALPDALKKPNTLSREKEEGLRIVAVSRGSTTALPKILVQSGLKDLVDEAFSIVQFGGRKTMPAWQKIFAMLNEQGLQPVRVYEDEWSAVQQLDAFRKQSGLDFQIVWVDRKNEGHAAKGIQRITTLAVAVE